MLSTQSKRRYLRKIYFRTPNHPTINYQSISTVIFGTRRPYRINLHSKPLHEKNLKRGSRLSRQISVQVQVHVAKLHPEPPITESPHHLQHTLVAATFATFNSEKTNTFRDLFVFETRAAVLSKNILPFLIRCFRRFFVYPSSRRSRAVAWRQSLNKASLHKA